MSYRSGSSFAKFINFYLNNLYKTGGLGGLGGLAYGYHKALTTESVRYEERHEIVSDCMVENGVAGVLIGFSWPCSVPTLMAF